MSTLAENAAIIRKKLAILNPLVASPHTLLDDAFDVVIVEAGKDYAHLGLGMPSVWYMNGLHCRAVSDDCPFDVVGVSFPGVPAVVLEQD